VLLPRYRCPCCKRVLTLRPAGFWPRVRTAAAEIFAVLRERLTAWRWPPGASRQRAGHWLRGLVTLAAFDFPGVDPLAVMITLHQSQQRFVV